MAFPDVPVRPLVNGGEVLVYPAQLLIEGIAKLPKGIVYVDDRTPAHGFSYYNQHDRSTGDAHYNAEFHPAPERGSVPRTSRSPVSELFPFENLGE